MLRHFIILLSALFPALCFAEPLTSPESVAVGTYPQEMRTAYTTADGLPSDDVLCIAVTDGGEVFAGTDKGLTKFDGKVWSTVADVPIICGP